MSREALVVGINRYPLLKDSRTQQPRHLLKAAADAEAVAQMLETYGNFRVQRLPEMVDDQGKWRVNPEPQPRQLPKVEQLKEAISQLLNPPSNPPKTALLFFSGHGLIDENGGIQEGYLATSDAKPPKTWGVSFHWLSQLLKNSPVQQIIIWLDCCHSGNFLTLAEADPVNIDRQKDFCFIAACRDFEVAYEKVGGEHGVLTGALLSALNPENYREGWVTNYRLIDQIKKDLAQTKQTPIFHNLGGDILLTGERKQLERAILMADVCPYKGLESFAFNAQDPQFFYGRTRLTDELLDRVRLGNFLAVLGASGAGKSSVVKAGLLYQLRLGQRISGSENWPIIIFRPGEHPLKNLIRALSKLYTQEIDLTFPEDLPGAIADIKAQINTERVVLVVDQFEEIFTLCEAAERDRFLACLLGVLDHHPKNYLEKGALDEVDKPNFLTVIITMRSDFFGKCTEQEYAGLADKIKNNLVPVRPMKSDELREAISQPAYQVGLEVQRELLEQIVGDVSGPGSLPLMQYTLTELWRNREVNRLTLAAYNQLGGVKGTLQKRAEEIYQELSDEEKLAAKRIFLELTQLGDGTEDTRRQIYKDDLVNQHQSIELVERTLKKLTDARLLVTSELQARGNIAKANSGEPIERQTVTAIDVAHEALIRYWPRLQTWLNENRATIRIERKIETFAAEWLTHGKPQHDLLTGSRLLEAEHYLQDYAHLGLLSALAQEYIKKSTRQRKFNRLLRYSLFAGVLGFLAAFGIQSYHSAKKAEALAREANRKGIEAEALVAAKVEWHPVKALVSVIALTGRSQQELGQILPRVQSSLSETVSAIRERQQFQGHQDAVRSVAFSPDGQTIISGSGDNTLRLWDREGNQLEVFKGHTEAVNSVAFSPDGQTIISGSSDNTLRLWDRKGNPLAVFKGHGEAVNSVAFSPDGQTIISGSSDRTLRLWDIYGNSLAIFTGHDREVSSVAFSPDGQTIISGSSDRTLRLWDIYGNSLAIFTGHDREVSSVAFSANGQTIISASSDNTLRLWDRKGNQLEILKGHDQEVRSVAFSSDGPAIVSGSNDNTLRLWDRKGNQLGLLRGHTEPVNSVAISQDGQTIVSGSDDNTVRLWDTQGNQLDLLTGHKEPVNSVAISSDGQTIVSGSDDNTVRLWDRNGKQLEVLKGHQKPVNSVAISQDGQTIVSGSDDKTVRLWDRNGKQLAVLSGHSNTVHSVAISPDGQTIVSGSDDKTVRLWDRNGHQLAEFRGHQDRVWSVAISPDGQTIVSGSSDNTVRLWDRNGKQLGEFRGHQDRVWSVAIAPSGQMIVSGSWDKTVRLWDRKGHQLGEFRGHQNAVRSVAISPDGQMIVSGSKDATVRLWSGSWQSWLDAGCERLRLHPVFLEAEALLSREASGVVSGGAADTAMKAVKTCEGQMMVQGKAVNIWNNQEKAEFRIKQGLAIARLTGDFEQAQNKFKQAQQLDREFYQSLGYDPEAKARELIQNHD